MQTGATASVAAWLRQRFGAESALLTDSGTSALSLALGVSAAGGPVALPAYACYDLATAADGARVGVLLYDVDPATLQPDWDSVQAAFAQGARALVVVHLYGIPVDLDHAARLTADAGGWLIEDAAQGAGGDWQGRPLGSFGDLSILSFGRGKGVTGGGGGALLAHSPRAIEELRALPNLPDGGRGLGALARAAVQWLLGRPSLYGIPSALPFLRLGETIYHPAHTATAMPRGAIGLLADALELTAGEEVTRRGNAERLSAALSAHPRLGVVRAVEGATPGYLRFPLVPELDLRDRLGEGRFGDLGVAPGYPRSLADLAGFEERVGNGAAPFPGARTLAARLVTCASHGMQRPMELDRCVARLTAAGAEG